MNFKNLKKYFFKQNYSDEKTRTYLAKTLPLILKSNEDVFVLTPEKLKHYWKNNPDKFHGSKKIRKDYQKYCKKYSEEIWKYFFRAYDIPGYKKISIKLANDAKKINWGKAMSEKDFTRGLIFYNEKNV